MSDDMDWQDWDSIEGAATTQPNTTCPSPIPPWHRAVQSPQTQLCVGDDTISLTMDTSYLAQTTPRPAVGAIPAGAPYELVLPDGNYARQIKRIYVSGANQLTTQPFKLMSNNFMGFGWLLFDTLGWSAVLEWDGAKWHLIGGNANPQN